MKEDMQPYINIVTQLTESLDCEANEIVDIVNLLNMTEYWVENKMLDVCDSNAEANGKFLLKYQTPMMREALWISYKEFIQKYKGQDLSLNELYDGSER